MSGRIKPELHEIYLERHCNIFHKYRTLFLFADMKNLKIFFWNIYFNHLLQKDNNR